MTTESALEEYVRGRSRAPASSEPRFPGPSGNGLLIAGLLGIAAAVYVTTFGTHGPLDTALSFVALTGTMVTSAIYIAASRIVKSLNANAERVIRAVEGAKVPD